MMMIIIIFSHLCILHCIISSATAHREFT